ncbi:hypothetical protein [Marinococcus halophilus]|uniref:hypothetical protein n=1 Tax=Marinococcus halophilus TaxID=1371 RepID=UPI0009A8F106|nr:hypothetical protein [Marinococcus halophilus]
MGVSEIMLLVVIVVGAILLGFSMFLFVKRKGTIGGPMLLAGVLAFGLGSFFLFASQSDNPVTPSSASSKEKNNDTDSNQSASQEMGDIEANENAAESGSDSNLKSSSGSGASAKAYEEQAITDITELLVQTEQLYETLDTYYYDEGYNYSTYEQAHKELLAFEELIDAIYPEEAGYENYEGFEGAYKAFLDELLFLASDLYPAIEDYYNGEDYEGTLAILVYEEPQYLEEAADALETSAEEAFKHYDFVEEVGGEGWEDSNYY